MAPTRQRRLDNAPAAESNHDVPDAAARFRPHSLIDLARVRSNAEAVRVRTGVPLLAVSAMTGKGLDTLLAAAFSVREAWSKRVSTAALNRWFEEAVAANPPPAPGGKRIKLRYITQAGTRPPRFVVFGTRLDDLPTSYERYLLNGIRRDLGFGAVPVRLSLRSAKNPFS